MAIGLQGEDGSEALVAESVHHGLTCLGSPSHLRDRLKKAVGFCLLLNHHFQQFDHSRFSSARLIVRHSISP
ncbi:hypothetical protein MBEBAB_2553 [Brevundimonas abyssalis TAR-001]|uniref:Uncharacterized protein n=1 Tax=Brevundimonas abyssalis TAR-001 TaxID=1391729 RepID=A0A8E0NDB0_9CAUL|nr:hypothetical protein MBEBAB_2553 [Brevundimonas abyssalis TAR-001]